MAFNKLEQSLGFEELVFVAEDSHAGLAVLRSDTLGSGGDFHF